MSEALRSAYSALAAAHEHMELLLKDEALLRQEEWDVMQPIHEDALQKASDALEEFDRIKFESKNPLGIKRWIRTGEFGGDDELPGNTNDVYYVAGCLLDSACSHEIFGTVVFEADNGKVYVMSVEGCLGEINPDYLKDLEEFAEQGALLPNPRPLT